VRAGLAPADDEAACAGWAASWDGSASNGDAVALTVARVDRLLAVGLRGAALAEALDASGVTDRRPIDLHRLAVAFNARALYPASMQAALRLGKLSPAGSAEEGPACLQRLVYPIVFPDLVQAEAQRYGLDPLYLTALLRQESWFDSHALSGAQARGMSQIISDTRRIIGRSLGQTSVTDLDLYRPRVAIAFGAFFLADTYHSLQERPILALAGYNAGPGQARRWTRGNMDIDPDTYVDGIDYGETRNYVRSIYQMYARYRSLY
jgi:soluble lytic murein transglycosylase